ncbi:MAG: hypothetical protein CMK07_08170 [Ponticaulis sp.]|nr:hypothetical protein [Ponticaulis sp.]
MKLKKTGLALSALLALALSGAASAQFGVDDGATEYAMSQKTFVETPECPVQVTDWIAPRGSGTALLRDGRAYGNEAITKATMNWYYAGPDSLWRDDYSRETLGDCLYDGSCGLKKNRRLANQIEKKSTYEWSNKEVDRFYDYFDQEPPASIINLATDGIGRCFGAHPGQRSMAEAGFVQADLSPEACEFIEDNPNRFQASGFSAFFRFYDPEKSCGAGTWVPARVAEKLPELMGDAYEALRLEAEAAERFANRSVEVRTQGLNGCQIAYGLIMGGINNSSVSRIPDEGITWALQYEKARIQDETCPLMPVELSNWVQAQPLETFEPAQDPFEFYRTNMPAKTAYDSWPNYVRTVMKHYESPTNPHEPVPESACYAFANWLSAKKFNNPNESRPDWRFLYDVASVGTDRNRSICVQVPVSMILEFQRDERIAEQQRIIGEEQFRKEEAARIAAQVKYEEMLRWKPSYRPPVAAPRCYRRNDVSEICFTDRR